MRRRFRKNNNDVASWLMVAVPDWRFFMDLERQKTPNLEGHEVFLGAVVPRARIELAEVN
jgi:hypothetical protein